MQTYDANKLKTALAIRQRIENWPAAWDLRLRRSRPGLRLLRFRDGLNVVCRGATRDWDVVHELMFAGGYGRALEYLRRGAGARAVIDLGGNLGLFSLLAASQSRDIVVHAFEPGPPNFRLFEINRLANYPLSEQIFLHREAVGGEARTTKWFFDERNPGGSSLYGTEGTSFDVTIRSFADVVADVSGRVSLVKIDIEGAEYELLEKTPVEVWQKIQAVSLELHGDPMGRMSQEQFMRRTSELGFRATEESVCSYFLERT